ncbi:MAG: aldo/keto reductase [Oscillospiraceae bacterium]|nr:aldo/keto reductase [Oscillospiraceae bacterium]
MHVFDSERYANMQYNRCGNSGLKLPEVSLGLWHNFGDTNHFSRMEAICRTAFDGGITHFDLANNYGPPAGAAERHFGQILKTIFAGHRDELIISTKAGYDMWDGPYGNWGSRKYLLASLDQSLQRMGLDYVDIFYHHRPDPETPLEETMGALAQAVQCGKALYVGLSNYDGEMMQKACTILEKLHCPFVINQNRYSMLDRTIEQNGMLTACQETGKGLIVFSPLAQGLLTDRYLHGIIPEDSRIRTDGRFLNAEQLTEERLAMLQQLQTVAQNRGQKLAQLAMQWILRQSAVTSVLIGASKPEQVQDALEMVHQQKLVQAEIEEIEQILGK